MSLRARLFALLLLAPCLALASVKRTFFYEEDTHFSLTYVLMRLACFSHKQALTIASADQAIDDNHSTSPGLNPGDNRRWHALDDSREAVLKRKAELWQRALSSKDLVQLGQYFHYQEDSWGHRQGHGVTEDWEPYPALGGHAKDFHQPDRVPYDKARARAMAKEKLAQAQEFNRLIGGKPLDVPSTVVDTLIDFQCLAYSKDALGQWNEADPDEVAQMLNNICQKLYAEGTIKKKIKTPTLKEKLGYKFDDDGAVTNFQDVREKLALIQDYNFPVVADPGPVEQAPAGQVANNALQVNVETSFTLEDTGQTAQGVVDWCYLLCKGGVHEAHAKCDASCDTPCPVKHGGKLKAYHEVDLSQIAQALPSAAKGPADLSATDSVAESQINSAIAAQLAKYDAVEADLPTNHFAKPCSAAMRAYGFKKYRLKMRAVVSVKGSVNGAPVDQSKTSDVGVATVYLPDVSKPMQTDEKLVCACEKSSYDSILPPKTRTLTAFAPAICLLILNQPLNPFYQNPKISGVDIEHLLVDEVPDGWEVYFPGGYTYYCDDPDCQGEVVLYDQIVQARIAKWGPQAGKGSITIESACLDIDKHQPGPSNSFKAAPVQDPVLRRLAVAVNWENARGPWDQARVWIYRNHATWEHINQRLNPNIAQGIYVRALYEVASAGKVDLTTPEYRHLLEPRFALDPFAPQAATLWFVRTVAKLDPDGLVKALDDGMADWGAKLRDNDRDYPHAADLIDGLAMSLDPKVRAEIPKLLAAIPADARPRVLRRSVFARSRS